MTPYYVFSSAILAVIVFGAATLMALGLVRGSVAVRASLWLGVAQAGLVVLSASLTLSDPISSEACLTAIFGFTGLAALGAIDFASLCWWRWSRRGEGHWVRPTLFIVVRVLSHGLFFSALVWHAQLCTV